MFSGEYLISPWAIYWISMLNSIRIILIIVAGCSLLAMSVNINALEKEAKVKQENKERVRFIVLCFIIFIMFMLMSALIPTKETAIQMYVASLTTPDNIQTIKDMGISLTEFLKGNLIDIIKEVKK